MKTGKNSSKKGIALVLTLGIIFMLGIMAGSFAFYSSMSSKNTNNYIKTLQAYNSATSGYNHMLGAINEFLDIIVEESVKQLNPGKNLDAATIQSIKNGTSSLEYQKLTNDQFNQLRSYLTTFLNGNTVDFTDSPVVSVIDPGGSKTLATTLNNKLFKNEDSWAKRYGIFKEGQPLDSTFQYDIDLDGVNNYVSDSFVTVEGKEVQKNLNILQAETLLSKDSELNISYFDSEEAMKQEQKDANWNILKDEKGKQIARFAVMAKDQSSLVNISGECSTDALKNIAEADASVSASDFEINNYTADLTGVIEMMEGHNVTDSYTSSSTRASQYLDLNTSDLTTVYSYLNEDLGTSASSEIKKSNAKITTNLLDYTDKNNIPTYFTKSSCKDKDLWSFGEGDIFAGIEGVRISEVNPHPEQIFKLGADSSTPLKISLKVKDKDNNLDTKEDIKIDEKDYFFRSEIIDQKNIKIKEQFRDSSSNSIDLSTATENEETYLKVQSPIEIRNPGGAYQVWLKMKISALNPAAALEKEAKIAEITDPVDTTKAIPFDIEVDWREPDTTGINWAVADKKIPNEQYHQSIREKSLVTAISKKILNASLLYKNDLLVFKPVEGSVNHFAPESDLSLADLVASLDSALDFENNDSILMTSSESSDPDKQLKTTHLPEMNLPTTGSEKPDAEITWNNTAGKTQSKTADELLNNYIQNKDTLKYHAFGSKVIEVAIFDENASNGKDELIGMFYCVNTNGFSEDDQPIAQGEWDTEDDDYIWFYSIGIPEWLQNPENFDTQTEGSEIRCNKGFPEWMKAQLDDQNQKTPLTDINKNIYNTNLCVFPRETCNLKFRFRLVDMANPRFNGGSDPKTGDSTPNYKLGVDALKYKDGSFTNEQEELTVNGQSIVGRPQWDQGDEVYIEIKDLLITQQLYDTSNQMQVVSDNKAKAAGEDAQKLLPKTYNKLSSNGLLIEEAELPKDSATQIISDTSLKNTIYYRNQRLENREANELGAGEFIEIFNGTGSPVSLDGWVLKIEQYKKTATGYQLLGPKLPNNYIDRNESYYDVDGNLIARYKNRIDSYDARPQYILLADAIIPSDQEGSGKTPFGLIANSLNNATETALDGIFEEVHSTSFYPHFFDHTAAIALGKQKMNSNIMDIKENGHIFFKDPKGAAIEVDENNSDGNCFIEKSSGDTRYIKLPKTGFPLDVGSGKFYNLREAPLGIDSANTEVHWYEKVDDDYGSYHEYETFNFASGNIVSDSSDTIKIEDMTLATFTYDSIYYAKKKDVEDLNLNSEYDKRKQEIAEKYLDLTKIEAKRNIIKIGPKHNEQYYYNIVIKGTFEIPYCDIFKINPDMKDYLYHQENYFELLDIDYSNVSDARKFFDKVFTTQITYYHHHTSKSYFKKANPFTSIPYCKEQETIFDWFRNLNLSWKEFNKSFSTISHKFPEIILFPALTKELIDKFKTDNQMEKGTGSEIDEILTRLDSGEIKEGFWKYELLTSSQKEVLFPKIFGEEQAVDLLFKNTENLNYPAREYAPDYNGNDLNSDNSRFMPAYYKSALDHSFPLLLKPVNNIGELKNFMQNYHQFDNIIIADSDSETGYQYNFSPHAATDLSHPIYKNKQYAFIPLLFNASRITEQYVAGQTAADKTAFNVNLGTTYNIDPNDITIAKTYNIPKENIKDYEVSLETDSSKLTTILRSYDAIMQNVEGIQPLKFRDDADRYIITLMAPYKSGLGIDEIILPTARLLQPDTNPVYDGNNKLHGTDQYYDLADANEWICSDKAENQLGKYYGVVDRAIIDKDNASPNPNNIKDWYGGRSMELNKFFTDPLKVRSVDSSSKIAEAAFYFEPHDQTYKTKAGPLRHGKDWAIKAHSSPGHPNFNMTEAKDMITQNSECPDVGEIPLKTINENGDLISKEDYIKSFETKDIDENDITAESAFFDYNHTGFGNYNHNFFSFKVHNFFIKDAPLASIAELCDVPAPSIENCEVREDPDDPESGMTDPLNPDSLINAILDGLEGSSATNYMSVTQKKKIFSGTSADSFEIIPANDTSLNFTGTTTSSNPLGQTYSNPVVFKVETGQSFSVNNFGLRYQFDCTGDGKKYFYPGRYKIFIEGLNYQYSDGTLFDAIKYLMVLPDKSLVKSDNTTEAISEDLFIKCGGAYLGGSGINSIINARVSNNSIPLREDHLVQIFPVTGGEYFNIQEFLEINFLMDSDSDFISSKASWWSSTYQSALSGTIDNILYQQSIKGSGTYQSQSYSEAKLVSFLNIMSSTPGYSGIKIHLVPEDTVGKVNINTASIQTLFLLPGFNDAVSSEAEDIERIASTEVLEDVIRYLNGQSGKTFTDAGDFLTASNYYELTSESPRGGKRIFPVSGNDIGNLSTPFKQVEGYANFTETVYKEMLARQKLKVFRTVLPHLQFDSSSFKITSLGQSLTPIGTKSFKVNASQKVTVDLNLNEKINTMKEIWVEEQEDTIGSSAMDTSLQMTNESDSWGQLDVYGMEEDVVYE